MSFEEVLHALLELEIRALTLSASCSTSHAALKDEGRDEVGHDAANLSPEFRSSDTSATSTPTISTTKSADQAGGTTDSSETKGVEKTFDSDPGRVG